MADRGWAGQVASERKIEEFKAANAQSPVVYGSVIGRGGEGCIYRLADERVFKLTARECELVGVPRWAFETAA